MSIIAVTAILQVLIIEFGGDAFKTTPLGAIDWLWCVGLGACSLPLGALLRLVPVDVQGCEGLVVYRTRKDTAYQPILPKGRKKKRHGSEYGTLEV